MLEFKFKNVLVSLSFSFFALFAVLFYASDSTVILLSLLACMLHESGHIIAMTLYKCTPQRIIFYGGGIKIIPNCRIISKEKEGVILAAGSAVNIILSVIFFQLNIFTTFAAASFSIGIFNLLPFKAFDGGQLLKLVFDDADSPKKERIYNLAVKIICLMIIILFFVIIFQSKMNISLAVTICYIIISEVLC